MKIQVTDDNGRQHQVEATPFEIEGSPEKFAVHRSSFDDVFYGYYVYSATHIESGVRVAHANMPAECIAQARRIWASKTQEELGAAIAKAMELKNN